MAKEIERKYLLAETYSLSSLPIVDKCVIKDRYLTNYLRIRNKDNKNEWIVTLKSEGTLERQETEFVFTVRPYFDESIYPILSKTRYIVPYLNQNFEINVFDNILYKIYT